MEPMYEMAAASGNAVPGGTQQWVSQLATILVLMGPTGFS